MLRPDRRFVVLLLGMLAAGCNTSGPPSAKQDSESKPKDEKITIKVASGQIEGAENIKGYYEVSGSKTGGTEGSSVSKSDIKRDDFPDGLDDFPDEIESTGGNAGSSASVSGIKQDDSPVEIDWPVTRSEFDKLKEGMSLEEARTALSLSALKYNPRSADSRFQLVCKHGAASVTLVFSGAPDVKLSGKSSQGLK